MAKNPADVERLKQKLISNSLILIAAQIPIWLCIGLAIYFGVLDDPDNIQFVIIGGLLILAIEGWLAYRYMVLPSNEYRQLPDVDSPGDKT